MVFKDLGRIFYQFRGITPAPFYILCLMLGNFNLVSFAVGLGMILAGEMIRTYSVGFLGIESRNTTANTKELITAGPYRFVRNPIYIGNLLIYSGFTVLSNVFLPLFPTLTLVFFVVIYCFVIFYEEMYLSEKFGEAYKRYKNQAPRFLPRLIKKNSDLTGDLFKWDRAVMSEKHTWVILGIAIFLLLIKFFIWN